MIVRKQVGGMASFSGKQVRSGTAFANGLHGRVATLRVQLPHNAVNMILDGEFGQIKVCSDFLVRQTPGEEGEELLLAGSDAEFRTNALVEYQGTL